ncbi:MAG: hypothetical protein ACRDVZ_09585 [Jiangellaceae bacterium]
MRRLAALLREQKDRHAALMTAEMGKPLASRWPRRRRAAVRAAAVSGHTDPNLYGGDHANQQPASRAGVGARPRGRSASGRFGIRRSTRRADCRGFAGGRRHTRRPSTRSTAVSTRTRTSSR